MTRRDQRELEAVRMLAWEQVRRDYVERARERAERVARGEPVQPVARDYVERARLRLAAEERGEDVPRVELATDPYMDEVPPPEVRRAVERKRRSR